MGLGGLLPTANSSLATYIISASKISKNLKIGRACGYYMGSNVIANTYDSRSFRRIEFSGGNPMSQLTCCHVGIVASGIFVFNQIAIAPARAAKTVAIIDSPTQQIDRVAPKMGGGLDIGLQPIVPNSAAAQRIAHQQQAAIANSGLNIGLQAIVPNSAAGKRIALQQGTPEKIRQSAGIGVSARVGTLGVGVDVAKSIAPQFNARLGANFGSVNFNRTDSGIDYNSQLNLSSVQLFGDYYPFGSNSNFRVTGGFLAQNNRFAVTGKPSGNGTYTIDGTQYPASAVGTLSGEFQYGNSIAPYLGIGIGKSTTEGFGFNADLGVMFAGSPKVTLTASNPTFNGNATARQQLDNQARQTEADLRGFNVYPVVSVGVSYAF